jgi:hypothetical protein
MNKLLPHHNTSRRHYARTLVFTGIAACVLLLASCTSTPQSNTGELSVPGRPGPRGLGGVGGGSGGGTGTGGAAGGAGGGVNTAPSAVPPETVGAPSMPEDGSKPNPVPTVSARSATGITLSETGTAPESGPVSAGMAGAGNVNGGEASGTGPDGDADGSGDNTEVTEATDASDVAGAENAQANASETGDETGETTGGTDLGGSEAGGAPGQTAGEGGQDDGELAGNENGQGAGDAGQAGEALAESGTVSDGAEAQGDAQAALSRASSTASGNTGASGADPAASVTGMPGGAAAVGETGAIGGAGPTTLAERRAAIRGRLDASYAVIDRLTLAERERVQRAANTGGFAASVAAGTGAGSADDQQDGGGGDGTGERAVVIVANASGAGGATMPAETAGRLGNFDNENAEVTYPIPMDIPSGDDDDTVARQLREAAMREANPDLRKKLWDEYRKYIGVITE